MAETANPNVMSDALTALSAAAATSTASNSPSKAPSTNGASGGGKELKMLAPLQVDMEEDEEDLGGGSESEPEESDPESDASDSGRPLKRPRLSPSSRAAVRAANAASGGGTSKPKKKGKGGSSCHQCKSRRNHTALTYCTANLSQKNKKCRKKFCGHCLKKFYKETPQGIQDKDTWKCPSCRKICCCAACRRRYQKQGLGGPKRSKKGKSDAGKANSRKRPLSATNGSGADFPLATGTPNTRGLPAPPLTFTSITLPMPNNNNSNSNNNSNNALNTPGTDAGLMTTPRQSPPITPKFGDGPLQMSSSSPFVSDMMLGSTLNGNGSSNNSSSTPMQLPGTTIGTLPHSSSNGMLQSLLNASNSPGAPGTPRTVPLSAPGSATTLFSLLGASQSSPNGSPTNGGSNNLTSNAGNTSPGLAALSEAAGATVAALRLGRPAAQENNTQYSRLYAISQTPQMKKKIANILQRFDMTQGAKVEAIAEILRPFSDREPVPPSSSSTTPSTSATPSV